MQRDLQGTLARAAPPRRPRPRRLEDQPRPPQHARLGAALLRPPRQPARPERAALRAEADRRARPRHRLLPRRRSPMAAPARRRPPAGWSRSTAWSTTSPTCSASSATPTIAFENQVPAGLEVDADPDQLFRVLVNLGRNAVQALDEAIPSPAVVRRLTVSGARATAARSPSASPTPARACPNAPAPISSRPSRAAPGPAAPASALPSPPSSSAPMAASIALVDTGGPGATFEIVIPDRPARTGGTARNGGG